MVDKSEKKNIVVENNYQMGDYFRMVLMTSLGFYLRIMKLGYPQFITDIELEVSRQVNWYMAGKFFIGKFPPFMGILSTGLARLVGYYGTEDLIYAGQPVVAFPLVALRRLSAILGTCLIPLCYMTLRNMGHSRSTATLASALLIFENGIVTQSRFTSPEVYVLFFSALTTCSWSFIQKCLKQSQGNLTPQVGFWQTITGISMGCALSSKWTGILLYPVIWTSIVFETWNKLCQKQNNVKVILNQVIIYVLSVGLLPLSVYLSVFQFHFHLASHTGDHDLLVSTKLRYSLEGNHIEPTQPNIAFGSHITIKHLGTVGGFLHSHDKRFVGGSTQQEVTLYPYADINNLWSVHKNGLLWNDTQPIEFVRNGDQIRLEHVASSRKLHSHDHRPQLTGKEEHSEVTAYGDKLVTDSHDFWNLQILNDDGTVSTDKTLTWRPSTQQFRLQHIRGCMLVSHNAWHIPPLGDGHQEVTCMAQAGKHIMAWQVDSSYHEQLKDMATTSLDKISMIEKHMEVHRAMVKYPSIVHNRIYTSSSEDGSTGPKVYTEETPGKWFFKHSSDKIWTALAGYSGHLVLHPIVQKLIVASLIVCVVSWGFCALLGQRQIKAPRWWVAIDRYDSVVTFSSAVLIQLALLSFLPRHMICMADILGAMYYGVGLVCVVLECCTARLYTVLRRTLFYGVLIACVFEFSQLSRLAYGGEKWFRSQCEASGLDIDCMRFPPAHADLVDLIENSGRTLNSTLLTIFVELAGGTTQALRYNQGQEDLADKQIAVLKQQSFLAEAAKTQGIYRYHRAIPTPPLTMEQATKWAQEVHQAALWREAANNQKSQE